MVALVEPVAVRAEIVLPIDEAKLALNVGAVEVSIIDQSLPCEIRETPEASIFSNRIDIVIDMGDMVTNIGEGGEDLEYSNFSDHYEIL